MPEMRRFGVPDLALLVLVLAAAAGARAGYLIYAADNARSAGPLSVQDPPGAPAPGGGPNEYQALAAHLRDNGQFFAKAPLAAAEEPTAHVGPGYPYFLWGLARLVPAESLDATVRWVQCGLGALTAGLYYLFGRRAFRSLTVGTLAGLLYAAHPFAVINTAAINDGVVSAFLLALALFLGARGIQTGGPLASLIYGIALAALALVRAALLPLAFVALAWFLLRSRTVSRGWLAAVVAFLGFATGLAPWLVRNWQTFHEPVPVADSAYLHLWEGNHPGATGGAVPPSDWKGLESPERAALPQPQRYAKLAPLVWEDVREHPVEAIQRRIRAGFYFFTGERFFTDRRLADRLVKDDEMPSWVAGSYETALNGTLLGMLALGVLGWRLTHGWRETSAPAALAVLWVVLPYVLGHAEGLSGPRLPLDGVLLSYAAFAVACAVPGVGRVLREGARPERVREQWR
jgi:4-amino-4-deoxy-L-arabinose transferase-like glycosyltransferase